MRSREDQPPGSPPMFLLETPPPRREREISDLSLHDGQSDSPTTASSPSSPNSRTPTPTLGVDNSNQPTYSSPQYPRPSRTTSIPRLTATTPDDTSSEEDNARTPTSTHSGLSTTPTTSTSKDHPTTTDFLNLYTRITTKTGPHRAPTAQEWGKETTLAYPKMYYQVAFLLWREAYERVHPPPRSPSPQPHHSVAEVKASTHILFLRIGRGQRHLAQYTAANAQAQTSIATINLIETPNALVKSILVATNFPLFTIGHHDSAEFILVPAPEVISSLKTVYAPWDKQLLGPHMLSLLGDSRFILHVLGTLRKREIYEKDLPFRESGYCICVQVDGRTGRMGRVYAIKSQAAGDCWLGRIAEGVEELGPGLEMSLTTVFPRAQRGVRTARVLVVEEEGREVLRGSHWYADEVGVEKAWEID